MMHRSSISAITARASSRSAAVLLPGAILASAVAVRVDRAVLIHTQARR